MPLPERAWQFGDRYIGRIKEMQPTKLENRGPDSSVRPYTDGYEIIISREYPPANADDRLTFSSSTKRSSKWGIWLSWWTEKGFKFNNSLIGRRFLFVEKEHVWDFGDRPTSIWLPNPVAEVSDSELEVIRNQKIKLSDLDLDKISAAGGNILAGIPEETDEPYPYQEEEREEEAPPITLSLHDRLVNLLNENGGSMSYERMVLEVLTSPEWAGDEEAKATIIDKDKLTKLGLGFTDSGEVLPF